MNLNYCAMSFTDRLLADSHALRAVLCFARFVGTFDLTFRLFTFDFADSVFRFLTRSSTGRRFTNRLANGWASWVIAFPSTQRMTLDQNGTWSE